MMFRLAHRSSWLLSWAVLASFPMAGLAQSPALPAKGRPIEFSESSRSASTNASRLEDRTEEQRKLLERDLTKEYLNPFEKFNSINSLDGVSVPPIYTPSGPSSIQSKKMKELIDRRKNWVFMTSEDFAAEPTTAELFNMPEYDENGQEKKEESALSRFYKSLDRTSKEERDRKKKDKNGQDKKSKKEGQGYESDEFESGDEDSEELRSLRESERSLKKLFEERKAEDRSLSPFSKPVTGDIFGLGNSAAANPAQDRTPTQKARMEEFKQLMFPSAAGSSLEPLKPINSLSPNLPMFGGMDSGISKPKLPASIGVVSPSIGSPVLGGGGISVVPLEGGQRPANSLTPTRIEPGRVNSAVPVFSVPQRKF